MRFGSLFSGVGGFDVGFERAGMTCVRQVERDKHCLRLLTERWPDVPKGDDVREEHIERGAVDLICGDFPCQDLSVAGKRSGLAGERSGLWFEFRRILDESRPQWVVIENVPGLLSSNKGADFAVVLRGLVELGYGVAWRILDAQYFGVAQRRRRVFIVGSLGDGRASQVLFEPESLCGDTPPSREAGESPAYSLRAGASHSGDKGDGGLNTTLIAMILNAHGRRIDGESETFVLQAGHTKSNGLGVSTGVAMTVEAASPQAVAFPWQQGGSMNMPVSAEQAPSLVVEQTPAIHQGTAVRRLTPVECERLQGFPDGWTAGFADSTRYRMMGNAVCVPVAEWLGHRLAALQ